MGANYGDEGKGKEVLKLTTKDKTLNIKHNGTCQSGHTAELDGDRHVFQHFGSGSFKGADTYFAKTFYINPLLFLKEYRELITRDIFKKCKFFADYNCGIITPYDMIVNQTTENARTKRHGSCGLGLFEAIQREKEIKLCFYNLQHNFLGFVKTLDRIRTFALNTLNSRGLLTKDVEKLITDENIFLQFCEDCRTVSSMIETTLGEYDHYIFEGGQGLRLCQDNMDEFPHLTPSNTGLKNIPVILKTLGLDAKVDVYYISRTYLSKHGGGDFKEIRVMPYTWDIEDKTNVPNEFQGTMRFGFLNIDDLKKHLEKDKQHVPDATFHFVLNCLDQTPEIYFYSKDKLMIKNHEQFVDYLNQELQMKVLTNEPA